MATNPSPTGDLRVGAELTIPAAELAVTFQTSGGPGGQHANRSATGVVIAWRYTDSTAITAAQKEQLRGSLGSRAASGELRVVADKSRSQWRNRSLARARLAELVAEALRPPPQARRPTRPSRAAQARRVEAKKRRGRTKSLRKRPEVD